MGGLLILISMVTGTAAFIALFKPLPRLWLPTRKRAAVVWVASFVLLFIGRVCIHQALIPRQKNWLLRKQKNSGRQKPRILCPMVLGRKFLLISGTYLDRLTPWTVRTVSIG